MKKTLALILALVMVLALTACGQQAAAPAAPAATETPAATEAPAETEAPVEEEAAVEYVAVDYAGFCAAELDTPVAVEAYVQTIAYNAEYGNISMFLADEDCNGYYVYRMACDDELAAKIDYGKKLKVCGYKAEWSGEVEITEAVCEVLDGIFVAEAYDVTALLGTDELAEHINTCVTFSEMTIEDSGDGAAFLYNWDGSGAAGSNNDLYFKASVNGETYSFTVESDECAEGSEVYTTVTELKVGDTVNMEGYLYWYEGPQPHIHGVAVVG